MKPLCIFLVLLYKSCQVLAAAKPSIVTQSSGIRAAKVGENVTLRCTCQDNAVTFLSWYKQSLGGNPHIVTTRMRHSTTADIKPAYKQRFKIFADKGVNDLIITDLHLSDSATYYCGVLVFNAIEFGQGVFLHIKTSPSNIPPAVHQLELQPFKPGDSLNLSCTAYAEPCVGQQNFYWFRHGASQPAAVYPVRGQCTDLSKSHRKNCTLNLTIKSVNSTDAGMYYCALASCGEIVFGSGTKVEVVESPEVSHLLVYCLSVALAVSISVLLAFVFILCKMIKESCPVCKGTTAHVTSSAASDIVSQDADSLHYAALSLKRNSGRHHPEDTVESVCVYSRIKSRKE